MLSSIKGLGPKSEQQLLKKGINSIEDLIFFYPKTYHQYSNNITIAENFAIECILVTRPFTPNYSRNKTVTFFNIVYLSKEYKCIAFNKKYLGMSYKQGDKINLYGTLNEKEEILVESIDQKHINYIKPVYSKISNLKTNAIHKFINTALLTNDELFSKSLYEVHNPTSIKELSNALYNLKYEEFKTYYLKIVDKQYKRKIVDKGYNLKLIKPDIKLYDYQQIAYKAILKILQSKNPQNILLFGEVGSGKTYIYLAIAQLYIANGLQVVIMAPTKILAKQIYNIAQALFNNEDILYATQKITKKQQTYLELGVKKLIIGTTLVTNNNIEYDNLGLIIIDEQQKFGTSAKEQLSDKNIFADVIEVTATPIPRTLSKKEFSLLKPVVIDYQRQGVKSTLITLDEITPILKELKQNKKQTLIICPFIEASENFSCANTKDVYNFLKKEFICEVLHGQQNDLKRDKVINAFLSKNVDVLISTGIVEVGINFGDLEDVIILNSERFGMAQLHQIRGRIGRLNQGGNAYFHLGINNTQTIDRMNYLLSHNNGSEIAQYDMHSRGYGDIIGLRQSGFKKFKIFNPEYDFDVIEDVITQLENN